MPGGEIARGSLQSVSAYAAPSPAMDEFHGAAEHTAAPGKPFFIRHKIEQAFYGLLLSSSLFHWGNCHLIAIPHQATPWSPPGPLPGPAARVADVALVLLDAGDDELRHVLLPMSWIFRARSSWVMGGDCSALPILTRSEHRFPCMINIPFAILSPSRKSD